MKRKIIPALTCALTVVVFTAGCGSTDTTRGSVTGNNNSVDQVVQSQMQKNDQAATASSVSAEAISPVEVQGEEQENPQEVSGGEKLDLTKLSSTVVYSEVYNIMSEPQDYLGRKIKMKGTVSVFHDNNDGKDYYACIIADATACCSQGIEFALKEGQRYPMADTEVTVEGQFSSYKIQDTVYYTLKDAVLL